MRQLIAVFACLVSASVAALISPAAGAEKKIPVKIRETLKGCDALIEGTVVDKSDGSATDGHRIVTVTVERVWRSPKKPLKEGDALKFYMDTERGALHPGWESFLEKKRHLIPLERRDTHSDIGFYYVLAECRYYSFVDFPDDPKEPREPQIHFPLDPETEAKVLIWLETKQDDPDLYFLTFPAS